MNLLVALTPLIDGKGSMGRRGNKIVHDQGKISFRILRLSIVCRRDVDAI